MTENNMNLNENNGPDKNKGKDYTMPERWDYIEYTLFLWQNQLDVSVWVCWKLVKSVTYLRLVTTGPYGCCDAEAAFL